MDKFFLLTYTCMGYDGFRHMKHAWFKSEAELRTFVEICKEQGKEPEIDIAIEIEAYREIVL